MMQIILAVLIFLGSSGCVFGQGVAGSPPNVVVANGGGAIPTLPCDILSGGCLSAWSVTQRLRAAFSGSLFQIYRDDGAAELIGALSNGYVDLASLHSFCDGHDCFFEAISDQVGKNPLNSMVGNFPLLGWDTNGLPMVVMTYGAIHAINLGGVMYNHSPVGLPTSGSRTMYIATSNYNWAQISEVFGYAGQLPTDGSGFVVSVTQTDPNTPSGAIFGTSLEEFHYGYGAYPPGYAQLIGMMKYNSDTNLLTAEVLSSSSGCLPSSATGCNANVTFQGKPPGYTSGYNTGQNTPNSLRLGQGTDQYAYGGRFQSAVIAAYATSTSEDTRVINALAGSHFPQKPTGCAATSSTLTAARPYTITGGTPETPNSYLGATSVNSKNLVFLLGTRVFNANWNGPLFRVQRADNAATYDIYPAGCEADALAISTDCAGTTCYVVHWWDQSGHNWNFKPPSALSRPTLSATGMNGLPCVQFSSSSFGNANTFTASLDASGVMTVSAISAGSLQVGQRVYGVSNLGTPTTIQAQLSGAAGSTGTYQLTPVTGTALSSSSSWVSSGAAHMMSDPSVWIQPVSGSGAGLYKNMTLEAIWQAPASGTFFGPLIAMPAGFVWNANQTPRLVYGYSGANVLTAGASVSAGTAHFSYLTADASSPQNLTMKSDAAAADTGTTTAAQLGNGGIYYQIGYSLYGSNSPEFAGCMSMAAVYNDVESDMDLTAVYNLAHAVYAAP